jgi:hypothetical protein
MNKPAPRQQRRLALILLLAAIGCVDPQGPTEPGPTLPTEVSISEQEHLACVVSPLGPGGYVDGLPGSGVTFEAGANPLLGYPMSGLLVADLDNDGCSDLLFPVRVGGVEIYWNDCALDGFARFTRAEDSLPSFQRLLPAVSAADVNGDGLLDLALAAPENPTLYLNSGDRSFQDHTDAYGLVTPEMFLYGMSWADMDQDGDLDMLLLRNEDIPITDAREGDDDDSDSTGPRGAGDDDSAEDCGDNPTAFEFLCDDGVDEDCDGLTDCDDTDDCGLDPLCGSGGDDDDSVGDDDDGAADDDDSVGDDDDDDSGPQGDDDTALPDDLDGILPNELWLNEDGLSFRAVEPHGPFESPNLTQHVVWWDLDSDGDLDLFEFNDFGQFANSRIWENQGPDPAGGFRWQERLDEMGLGILLAPMGAIVTDLNGDLQPDIWVSDVNETRMFKNLGGTGPDGDYQWSFVDVGHGIWVDPEEHRWSDISWSVVRVDPDGDGKPEVFISYGWAEGQDYPGAELFSHIQQPDRLLVNQNEWGEDPWFVSDPAMLPVEPANAIGTAKADLNGDGIGDLVVLNLDGPPTILLGKCTEASRLVIKLDDRTTLNRFGIGARVDVDIGGRVQSQVIGSDGQGSYSFSEPVLFFGTGEATEVDSITVRWPGPASPVSELTRTCANCKLTIRRE